MVVLSAAGIIAGLESIAKQALPSRNGFLLILFIPGSSRGFCVVPDTVTEILVLAVSPLGLERQGRVGRVLDGGNLVVPLEIIVYPGQNGGYSVGHRADFFASFILRLNRLASEGGQDHGRNFEVVLVVSQEFKQPDGTLQVAFRDPILVVEPVPESGPVCFLQFLLIAWADIELVAILDTGHDVQVAVPGILDLHATVPLFNFVLVAVTLLQRFV